MKNVFTEEIYEAVILDVLSVFLSIWVYRFRRVIELHVTISSENEKDGYLTVDRDVYKSVSMK